MQSTSTGPELLVCGLFIDASVAWGLISALAKYCQAAVRPDGRTAREQAPGPVVASGWAPLVSSFRDDWPHHSARAPGGLPGGGLRRRLDLGGARAGGRRPRLHRCPGRGAPV